MLQAGARVAAQAAPDQPHHAARHGRRQCAPVRLVAQHRGGHLGDGPPGEDGPGRQHLEQHAAEGPDVGPGVDVAARHLFRAHVARGPDDQADLGDRLDRLLAIGPDGRRLGQAEVDELHLARRRQHDVRRLEVAVNHTLGVGFLEAGDDLDGDGQRVVDRHRPADQALGQRFAVDPLEDEVGRPVQPFQAVDGGDVRMTEGGEDARFALEPPQAPGIAAEGVGQALDGDFPIERGVEGAVDAAHAARTQQVEDLVAADLLAEGEAITARFVERRAAPRAAAARQRRSRRLEQLRLVAVRMAGVGLRRAQHLAQLGAQPGVAGRALVDPAFAFVRRQLEHGAEQRAETRRGRAPALAALAVAHRDVPSFRGEALTVRMTRCASYLTGTPAGSRWATVAG